MPSCTHPGPGTVPPIPLLAAAKKQLGELPSEGMLASPPGMAAQLDFTTDGLQPNELSAFFEAALAAGKKKEPIIESGNKYGVSDDFHRLNSELLMDEVRRSAAFSALAEADRQRADEFVKLVLFNKELRNRNPLHPSILDSAVIGNLMNFPKHIFCLPLASYATDGNEALSLLLFAYRQEHSAKMSQSNGAAKTTRAVQTVLYVTAVREEVSDSAPSDLRPCAARLGMGVDVIGFKELSPHDRTDSVAVVLTSWNNPDLGAVAAWAARRGLGLHIHLSDAQWRAVFVSNQSPVHVSRRDSNRRDSIHPATRWSLPLASAERRTGAFLHRILTASPPFAHSHPLSGHRVDVRQFQLPPGVRSITIEHGLLHCGYSLYRDAALRDAHFDVGCDGRMARTLCSPLVDVVLTAILMVARQDAWSHPSLAHAHAHVHACAGTTLVLLLADEWQTAYLSPNEGGSGASTPLYLDFCFILLGWAALSRMARHGAAGDRLSSPEEQSGGGGEIAVAGRAVPSARCELIPTQIPPGGELSLPQGAGAFGEILAWAKQAMERGAARPELETKMVQFQRSFLGGGERELECCTTGGGTRSINLAFESVCLHARATQAPGSQAPRKVIKVLTGNPHLAVERAERRFGFKVVRVVKDGAICLEQLAKALGDPMVYAVYSQSLSYTDGISDNIPAIVRLMEEENQKRSKASAPLVTLINDSCLAFSVLVHHDGEAHSSGGEPPSCMRALDLTRGKITPTIVTLDAHKHLGTDKGVSSVVGTAGAQACVLDLVWHNTV